jgi:Zn/Cd-binding protein ZinT
MDVWQAEYLYDGFKGGKYIFKSDTQGGTIDYVEFSDSEIKDEIKSGLIIQQK